MGNPPSGLLEAFGLLLDTQGAEASGFAVTGVTLGYCIVAV